MSPRMGDEPWNTAWTTRLANDTEVERVEFIPTHSALATPLAASIISGSQMALIAAIAVASGMMLISNMRRRREGGPSPRAYAREQLAHLKEKKAVHDELGEIMIQLQQVTREINAQLDAKFLRLERVVRDADERIARLEKASPPPKSAPPKRRLDVTVGQNPRRQPKTTKPDATTPQGQREIFALADAGKTPAEIAESIGTHAGEVELVLALRRTKPSESFSAKA